MSATLPTPTLFLDTNLPLFSGFPHRVADLSEEQVRFGRKELDLALVEMPGLSALRESTQVRKPLAGAKIMGSLHTRASKLVFSSRPWLTSAQKFSGCPATFSLHKTTLPLQS